MPLAFLKAMFQPQFTWNYRSEPEPALEGRTLWLPRGKVLGGTSSINGMFYMRGHSRDFDTWRDLGCEGWGYRDVLPYFKRMETSWRGANAWHGDRGPLHVCAIQPVRALHVRPADGDRREEKEQRRQRKERRVDREDPPEERKCRSTHLEDRLGVLPPRSAHLSGPRPVRDSSRTSTATNTASTRATPTNVAVMKSWGSMATSSADASAIVTAAARSSRAGSRRRRARLSWRDP